jgi:hypothetical protein
MTDEEFAEVKQEVIDRVVAGLIPATAAQVGVALGNLTRLLDQVGKEWTAARTHAGELAQQYQLAFDLAFVELTNPTEVGKLKYTVEAAKSVARIEVYELGLELAAAKSNANRLRVQFETIQDRIRAGQTNAATFRAEARNIGYGAGA